MLAVQTRLQRRLHFDANALLRKVLRKRKGFICMMAAFHSHEESSAKWSCYMMLAMERMYSVQRVKIKNRVHIHGAFPTDDPMIMLSPADERHLRCHDADELNICLEAHVGHQQHRVTDMHRIHRRFGRQLAICLQGACGRHACRH